jgi:hypothetical protein
MSVPPCRTAALCQRLTASASFAQKPAWAISRPQERVREIGGQRPLRMDDQHGHLDHLRRLSARRRERCTPTTAPRSRSRSWAPGRAGSRRTRMPPVAAWRRCRRRPRPLGWSRPRPPRASDARQSPAVNRRLIRSSHSRPGFRVVGVHAGHTCEGAEARVFRHRTHHRPSAEADAQAEEWKI